MPKTTKTTLRAADAPDYPGGIVVEAAVREKLPVRLVGQDYTLTPPKAALALKLATRAKTSGEDPALLMQTLTEWVAVAFGPEGSAQIQARLDDPEDELDVQHISELVNAVLSWTADRPTTSSSA